MAIFFVDVKTFSRAKGESAVAAAAYRAGTRLVDERTGVAHDYTRRHGVVAVAMFATDGAPGWARDAGRLFVEAEKSETRVNARTARELQVALPFELDGQQRAGLVAQLAGLLVDRYGVAVLAATHEPTGKGDERNVHCHLLFTTRAITPAGFGAKTRVLDDRAEGPKEVEFLRAAVAELTNAALVAAGVSVRVDHRKLTVQAAEAEAAGDLGRAVLLTRAVVRTEGKAGTAARRRRESTPRTRWNDLVRHDNRVLLANFLVRAKMAARRTRVRPAHGDVRTAGWSEPGRGPGTRVLNVQGERLRRGRQADDAGLRRWLAMLERERLRIAEESRKTLAAYAVAARLKRADVRALVTHAARDPGCFEHLSRLLAAREKYRAALQRSERARATHAAAMVRTAAAARQAEANESETPPVWRPMTRRAWADHRRRQRAALVEAQTNERAAAAIEVAGTAVELAEWERLERQRRTRYPCPTDRATGVEIGVRAPWKIGNKIAEETAGEPAGSPRPTLAPRLSRRRRPSI